MQSVKLCLWLKYILYHSIIIVSKLCSYFSDIRAKFFVCSNRPTNWKHRTYRSYHIEDKCQGNCKISTRKNVKVVFDRNYKCMTKVSTTSDISTFLYVDFNKKCLKSPTLDFIFQMLMATFVNSPFCKYSINYLINSMM